MHEDWKQKHSLPPHYQKYRNKIPQLLDTMYGGTETSARVKIKKMYKQITLLIWSSYYSVLYPVFWSFSSSLRISRGVETTWKIRQFEVRENSLFYCSRVTWCSTRTYTLTSCPLPWHFRKIRVDNVFFSSFNYALPKIKVRPLSPDFRVEAH